MCTPGATTGPEAVHKHQAARKLLAVTLTGVTVNSTLKHVTMPLSLICLTMTSTTCIACTISTAKPGCLQYGGYGVCTISTGMLPPMQGRENMPHTLTACVHVHAGSNGAWRHGRPHERMVSPAVHLPVDRYPGLETARFAIIASRYPRLCWRSGRRCTHLSATTGDHWKHLNGCTADHSQSPWPL
jgi:hypothetical protein